MRAVALHNPEAPPLYADSLRLTVADGDEGVYETLQVMRAAAEDAVEHGHLVARAAAAIAAAVPRGRGHAGETDPTRDGRTLAALYAWLRRRVVFKRDPWRLEHIRHPDQLLTEIAESRDGRTSADCDDVATLGAALVRALGMEPAFVVAARSRESVYEHVFFAAVVAGRVVPLDPQEGLPPGRWPAVARLEVLRC